MTNEAKCTMLDSACFGSDKDVECGRDAVYRLKNDHTHVICSTCFDALDGDISIDYEKIGSDSRGFERSIRWLESMDYMIDPTDSEVCGEYVDGKYVVTSSMLSIYTSPGSLIGSAVRLVRDLKALLGADDIEAWQEENCSVWVSAVFDPVGMTARIVLYGLDDSLLPIHRGDA